MILRRCLWRRVGLSRLGVGKWRQWLLRLLLWLLLDDTPLLLLPFDHKVGQDAESDEERGQRPGGFLQDVGGLARAQDLRGGAPGSDTGQTTALS